MGFLFSIAIFLHVFLLNSYYKSIIRLEFYLADEHVLVQTFGTRIGSLIDCTVIVYLPYQHKHVVPGC